LWISAGFQQGTADLTIAVLTFTAVVALDWAWIPALSVRLMNELSETIRQYSNQRDLQHSRPLQQGGPDEISCQCLPQ
jgi:hypothetical protein